MSGNETRGGVSRQSEAEAASSGGEASPLVASRAPDERLSVTQIRSAIGAKPKARGTLRALGLGRIGQTNSLPDRPEIRGMLARVPHLVRVEDSSPEEN
jgi:large subunit ribosomal protein L30